MGGGLWDRCEKEEGGPGVGMIRSGLCEMRDGG